MKPRAVLFDLDGTLLDSLEDIADAMNAVLGRLGLPGHPRDAYRYFVGDGMEALVRRALPPEGRDEATVARALPAMRTEYGSRSTRKTRPYPGIAELLDALAERGIPVAILTNKPQDPALELVAAFFASRAFVAILGARPDLPRKPDPTGALQVAKAVGIAPEQWLYLGDTATDMRTAKSAGMKAVGVLWGFREASELAEAGADVLIGHPMEALPLLG